MFSIPFPFKYSKSLSLFSFNSFSISFLNCLSCNNVVTLKLNHGSYIVISLSISYFLKYSLYFSISISKDLNNAFILCALYCDHILSKFCTLNSSSDAANVATLLTSISSAFGTLNGNGLFFSIISWNFINVSPSRVW